MKNLIILDKNDLRDLLQEMLPVVRSTESKEIDKSSLTLNKPYLTMSEGLRYLNNRVLKMTKSTLYKYTEDKTIPFQRFGERKIVFVRKELDKWIEERLSGNDNTLNKAI